MVATQFLTELNVASRRYEEMARPWYLAKGKSYPGDPAQPIIDAVERNDGYADKQIGLLMLTKDAARKLTEKGGGSV